MSSGLPHSIPSMLCACYVGDSPFDAMYTIYFSCASFDLCPR